jgi:LPS export ABC transporter protein LptC
MLLRANIYLKKLLKLLVIPGVFCLAACENDIEKIKSLTNISSLPEISGQNIETIYTDSAKIKMKLVAAEIRQFGKAERPYVEFPKGIHVIFYNDSLGIKSEIFADYAKYFTVEKLWEAHGNVIAHNIAEGEKLNTEELFWDEGNNRIYSNSFSRIESKDFIYYGQKGFVTNQKFSPLKLKGSNGSVNIKDEKNPNKNP